MQGMNEWMLKQMNKTIAYEHVQMQMRVTKLCDIKGSE